MKKFSLLSLFATLMLLTLVASAAADQLYFYGGDLDPDNVSSLANENDAAVSGDPYGAATYQNFVVSSPITVTGLFTNDLMNFIPTQAYWEIRSGVSQGNGGTLIASGTNPDIVSLTGRSFSVLTEYNNLVSGLSVNLASGTYWFAVVPLDLDPNVGNRSFNSITFGFNAVGTQINGNQYFNSSVFEANFINANNDFFGVTTFSSGVYTGTSTVPEPSTLLLLLGTGLGSVALSAYRRKKA